MKNSEHKDTPEIQSHEETDDHSSSKAKDRYKRSIQKLQEELVKLQRHFIAHDQKILILFEGRDASGKDGAIKRIIQYLSPRETRVVALGKPSDRDRTNWYFQRYVRHLPSAQELVVFNRSWYNRAGVERVMGFCSKEELEEFLSSVNNFENMLIHSGVKLFKYYLDIDRSEQKRRLLIRRSDPLKQWKTSPIDLQAVKRWKEYSAARNDMLVRTHQPQTPWTMVCTNDKRSARINIMKDLLGRLDYTGKNKRLVRPDRKIIFDFDPAGLENGMIAK